jgi:hypothetical protein
MPVSPLVLTRPITFLYLNRRIVAYSPYRFVDKPSSRVVALKVFFVTIL